MEFMLFAGADERELAYMLAEAEAYFQTVEMEVVFGDARVVAARFDPAGFRVNFSRLPCIE